MRLHDKLPGEMGAGIVLGVLSGLAIFMGVAWLLWQIPWPMHLGYFVHHVEGWLSMVVHGLNASLFTAKADNYALYLRRLPAGFAPWMFTARFELAAVLGSLGGAFVGYVVGCPQLAERHIAGRQLFRGKAALSRLGREARQECGISGVGLRMHAAFPWYLSLDREARHFLVTGSVGSGKTQIILSLVLQAIGRGDRLVVYDNKGDYTRLLTKITLLAPWDARSGVWDIAKDCSNRQDVIELAARLVPEGQDPVWHQAARQILAALIMKLQQGQPGEWTWRDLYREACAPMEDLLAAVAAYKGEARHILEMPGKTAQSVLINLGASLGLVADLAAAWDANNPASEKFSFSRWLQDEDSPQRVVVLQGSGRYAALARAYIQSALALMSGRINSPEFAESRERRLWFVLDEFAQLGALKEFAPLLEIGRSKGVRVVLGAQDISQIKDLYGEHVADSWSSIVGTQIVARVNAGETANFISHELVGTRTVDRVTLHNGQREPVRREQESVVEPSELSTELGVDREGIRSLLLGYGDAYILNWPFIRLPMARESSIPAAWLSSATPLLEAGVAGASQGPRPRLKLRKKIADDDLFAIAETGSPWMEGDPIPDGIDGMEDGGHE